MADIIVQGNIDDTVVPMLNNSGGALALGDVVIVDITANNAVTTTNVFGNLHFAGVIKVGGLNGSIVKVLVSGKGKIKVDGHTDVGDWLRTSNNPGLANPTVVNQAGLFGIATSSTVGAGVVDFIFKHCFT